MIVVIIWCQYQMHTRSIKLKSKAIVKAPHHRFIIVCMTKYNLPKLSCRLQRYLFYQRKQIILSMCNNNRQEIYSRIVQHCHKIKHSDL